MASTKHPSEQSSFQEDHPHNAGDRAIGPATDGPGTPKGPKRPQDTTSSGDAKDGTGEDNHQQK